MYTLGDIPRKSAILFPNNTATVFEGARLTYRQLNERVNRLANALLGLGVAKGDRLAILAENTHKYLEVYFAAAKIGLSATPLNFRLSDQELLHIVNDSDATCFFVGDGYEDRARKMKDSAAAIKHWIAMDSAVEGHHRYEELLASAASEEPNREPDEHEMAILAAALNFSFNRNDATCFVLPLFHVSFWPAFAVLLTGGKVVINRKPDL